MAAALGYSIYSEDCNRGAPRAYRKIRGSQNVFLACLFLVFSFARHAAADVTPSGAYQSAIPIEVPPYHGLEPRLSLVYNSNAGNGFLGVGWGLAGYSTIQRSSRGRGVPWYDTQDISQSGKDIAFLDGMELVKCAAGVSSPSCQNPSSGSTKYSYYATKLESYQRIAYDPTAANGAWYVWRKDGTKLTYVARFVTPKGTYRWMLNTVEDTLLNKVTYNVWCDPAQDPNFQNECYLDKI